jgi:hypothetical protein
MIALDLLQLIRLLMKAAMSGLLALTTIGKSEYYYFFFLSLEDAIPVCAMRNSAVVGDKVLLART